jgi:hypothetical protein
MELTTDPPQSSHGIPVLLVDGVACGAFDRCKPSAHLADDLVRDSDSLDKALIGKF